MNVGVEANVMQDINGFFFSSCKQSHAIICSCWTHTCQFTKHSSYKNTQHAKNVTKNCKKSEQAVGIYDQVYHQSRTSSAAADHSPGRCNLFGCPALFLELFSAGIQAPACVDSSGEVAADSSPTVPSGPASAGEQQRVVPSCLYFVTESLAGQ